MQTGSREAAADEGRRVVIHAQGHPHVRATHAKTLEIIRDTAITARATCVIGVGGDLDPAPIGLLRGPVRLTVAVAGREVTGHGVINPGHAVADRLVVRRSDRADPDTLVVGSTLTAAELDPVMVEALTDPSTTVTLTVAETGERRPLVLVGSPGTPVGADRLGLLWRHADAVVDLGRRGAGAPAALDHGGTVAVSLAGDHADPAAFGGRQGSDSARAWLAGAAGRGARFAIMPGSPAASPAAAALLAAGLSTAPVLWLGQVDKRSARSPEIAGFLRSPPPVPVVLTVPTADADAVLGPLGEASPGHRVAVQRDPLDVGIAMEWLTAADAIPAAATGPEQDLTVVIAPAAVGAGRVDLDQVVRALAAAGVSPRTLSEALAPLGLNRRRAYQAVQAGHSGSAPVREASNRR